MNFPKYKYAYPEKSAWFPSRITFWWITRLIRQGYKNVLTENDVWELPESEKTNNVVESVQYNIDRKHEL
ncbi:unnamed protein product [Didymodactylos carnosus]|uniref:Uncharacterized protein n=1 Tax=Didymodactylos carnosus TaxID=1234261 RepID=A0A815V023_9BILA|nr:unnamed protein product [Didymodactylos carnosus]CAF4383229.1 unnamed protein product [Didymodactylos carnosus]